MALRLPQESSLHAMTEAPLLPGQPVHSSRRVSKVAPAQVEKVAAPLKAGVKTNHTSLKNPSPMQVPDGAVGALLTASVLSNALAPVFATVAVAQVSFGVPPLPPPHEMLMVPVPPVACPPTRIRYAVPLATVMVIRLVRRLQPVLSSLQAINVPPQAVYAASRVS